MDGLLGHFRMHFIDCYFGIFITFAATRRPILFLLTVLNGKMQGNLIRKHSRLLGVWYQGDEACFMPVLFEYTVVEFSTRTPSLIICQFLKFRLLWSQNMYSDMNKCMIWAISGFKTFWLLKMALLGKNLLNFLSFYYIKSTFFGKKREAYGLCHVII